MILKVLTYRNHNVIVRTTVQSTAGTWLQSLLTEVWPGIQKMLIFIYSELFFIAEKQNHVNKSKIKIC